MTKPITVRARWSQFYSFMGMTVYKELEEEDRKGEEDAATWKEEMKKASTGQYGSGSTLTLGCS